MMSLPYSVLIEAIESDGEREFSATVPDLPGCVAAGDTPEEALENVKGAIAVWLDDAKARGVPVPQLRRHSGRFTVRVPSWVHAELETQAVLENVSVNQYVASILTYHLGRRSAERSAPKNATFGHGGDATPLIPADANGGAHFLLYPAAYHRSSVPPPAGALGRSRLDQLFGSNATPHIQARPQRPEVG